MPPTPSAIAANESKPAPMPLLLVQGFVNTRDLEEGTDLLADPQAATAWLVDAGLLAPGARPSAAELERACEVREGLRLLIAKDPRAADGLRELVATHRARLTLEEDGVVGLERARHEDLGDALFGLLLIVHRAQQDGSWSRLKVCANPDCRWAFFDRSRNHQGSWCEMATCGNRHKNRELRARRG